MKSIFSDERNDLVKVYGIGLNREDIGAQVMSHRFDVGQEGESEALERGILSLNLGLVGGEVPVRQLLDLSHRMAKVTFRSIRVSFLLLSLTCLSSTSS